MSSLSKKKPLRFLMDYPIIIVILIFILGFSSAGNGFFTGDNFSLILRYCNQYGFLAIGVTLLVINGQLDLSVGMTMGLAANVMAKMLSDGSPFFISILMALLVGVAVGVINSFAVVYLKINSLVATLMATVGLRGVAYLYTNSEAFMLPGEVSAFGNISFLGISLITWILLVLIVVFELILRKTVHGRETFSIGGSEMAARNVGINVSRVTTINFIICSVMAATGGIFQAIRLGATNTNLGYSDGRSMLVLICVVLGGNKLSGGSGNMIRALLGVLTMSIIQNGIDLVGLESTWRTLTMGVLLIVIVIIDQYMNFGRSRKIRGSTFTKTTS